MSVGFGLALVATGLALVAERWLAVEIATIGLIAFASGLVSGFGRWALATSMQILIATVLALGLPPMGFAGVARRSRADDARRRRLYRDFALHLAPHRRQRSAHDDQRIVARARAVPVRLRPFRRPERRSRRRLRPRHPPAGRVLRADPGRARAAAGKAARDAGARAARRLDRPDARHARRAGRRAMRSAGSAAAAGGGGMDAPRRRAGPRHRARHSAPEPRSGGPSRRPLCPTTTSSPAMRCVARAFGSSPTRTRRRTSAPRSVAHSRASTSRAARFTVWSEALRNDEAATAAIGAVKLSAFRPTPFVSLAAPESPSDARLAGVPLRGAARAGDDGRRRCGDRTRRRAARQLGAADDRRHFARRLRIDAPTPRRPGDRHADWLRHRLRRGRLHAGLGAARSCRPPRSPRRMGSPGSTTASPRSARR